MEIGIRIKNHFEKNIHALSRYRKGHYAKRMHRITGSPEYSSHAREHLLVIKEQFIEDIKNIDDLSHIRKRSEEIYDRLSEFGTPEAQIRRKNVFRDRKEHLFFYRLIESAHMLKEAGAFEGSDSLYFEKWAGFLREKIDFGRLLLKDDIFREFSTQLVNYIYFLKIDGIVDKTSEFKALFSKIFGDNNNDNKGQDFINKIYTMTHFIIAASDYYQQFVDEHEFGWILEYFSRNMPRIVNETNPDVIFEVGICFKLAGKHGSNEVEIAKSVVLKEHDESLGYIPRKDGSLEQSEHANIMAIILMYGFDRLHRGPRII